MPPVLNAEVFTRRTVTVHEDFDTQVDRFTPDLWREYAEKRPVSIKFHLDHIAVSDPNDDYREYAEKRPVSTEFHLDHIAVSDPNDDYQVAVRRWRNALVHSTVFPKWTRPAEIFTVHEEPAELLARFVCFATAYTTPGRMCF